MHHDVFGAAVTRLERGRAHERREERVNVIIKGAALRAP